MNTTYSEGLHQQVASLRTRLDAGMPRLGWKVGINVPEVQRKLGLSRSLLGWLDGDRVFVSGSEVPLPSGGRVHVEPELCLRIGSSVGSTANRDTASGAVAAIAPALELVDYARAATSLADVIAGSMFHYATVLGSWQSPRADLDIASAVRLRAGSTDSEVARSDLVPLHLGDLVLFVAELLEEMGQQLLPGDHILTGSFTAKALPLLPGEEAQASLGDFGVVSCLGATAAAAR